ncbi:MAG: hypothetical protein AUI11_03315 [Acidobacteria bacterium 13_2_20CM_2_66_4]|nr:MAG: hypothetical protein AUI11_03315 [Acidobacteria bacterium 13_2_20CM_2_66_4]
MIARERRVIAPHFCPRPFGVCEEIQIVNRHDPRRRFRRQQQRMKRMRHVEPASGQRFRGRPVQTMPCEVEQADRHAPIDCRRAGQFRARNEPVLPRAGKDSQVERSIRSISRTGRDQRSRELMRVLADAAPLAQRGAIVHQHAHGRTLPYAAAPTWRASGTRGPAIV